MSKHRRVWLRSFYTKAIAFRYLLTPFGTITRTHTVVANAIGGTLTYRDYYIFGIRIARIHPA